MHRFNGAKPANAQHGLSLIELMIALTLGLILTLGVVQVFLGSSQTYRLTDGLAVLQENMRFALGNLQRDSRMAGHYGCLVGLPANQLNPLGTGYDDNVYNVGKISAMGWEATGTELGKTFAATSFTPSGSAWTNGTGDPLPADIVNDVIPGTDILVVNGGVRADVTLSGNPVGSNAAIGTVNKTDIAAGTIILAVASDCGGGDLFQKTNNDNSTGFAKGTATGSDPGNVVAAAGFSETYDNDASVYEFISTAYYLGDGTGGEPALFRDRLDAGDPFGEVELVSGVESMQVLYGVANNPEVNSRADSYVTAAGVNDWSEVVSVRIALLMRSSNNVVDEAATQTYNLIGTQISTQSDRRARLVGVATVGIRNRLK